MEKKLLFFPDFVLTSTDRSQKKKKKLFRLSCCLQSALGSVLSGRGAEVQITKSQRAFKPGRFQNKRTGFISHMYKGQNT